MAITSSSKTPTAHTATTNNAFSKTAMSLGTITIITSRLELRRKQRHCHLTCLSRGVSGLSFPKPHDLPEKREKTRLRPNGTKWMRGCGAQCSTVSWVPSPVLRSTTSPICCVSNTERVYRTVCLHAITLSFPSFFLLFFLRFSVNFNSCQSLVQLHTPGIDIIV